MTMTCTQMGGCDELRAVQAERDALRAQLEAMQRQEPVALEDEMLDTAISWCDSNGINVLGPEELSSLIQSLCITVRDTSPLRGWSPAAAARPMSDNTHVAKTMLLDAIEALQAENERLKYEVDAIPAIKAERDALQAENERLTQDRNLEKKLRKDSDERAHNAEAERDALAAKLVPLEADAERYRWLSHHLFATAHGYDTTIGIDSSDSRIWINGFASYDMDAAIDAAKGGQHEDA